MIIPNAPKTCHRHVFFTGLSIPLLQMQKEKTHTLCESFLFGGDSGREPIKCKAPVEPCSLRAGPQRHLDLIESCCLIPVFSAQFLLNASGLRTIPVSAHLASCGKVRRKAADHIIAFVTATFLIRMCTVSRTVPPLISGY